MNRVWRVILILSVILMMGFAVLSSVDGDFDPSNIFNKRNEISLEETLNKAMDQNN